MTHLKQQWTQQHVFWSKRGAVVVTVSGCLSRTVGIHSVHGDWIRYC